MENIESELLLNFCFKDGYMFSCPDRLFWAKMKEDLGIVNAEDLDDIDFENLELGDEKVDNEN